MSTILDALRKVEENQRTRSADVRARLLSFPTRPDAYSSRQRRTPWLVGAGLALAGFAAGAGLMLWGPHSRAPEEGQLAKETGLEAGPDKGVKPLTQPPVQPPPQPAAQSLAQAPAEILPTPAPAPAEIPAPAQVATAQPPSLTPPAPVPAAVPPAPQTAMPKFPSPIPPLPTPTETPSVPSAPVVAATPPEVRSAPVAPLVRPLTPEERRSALRAERRARRTHGGALPPEVQDLAKAARAARAQSRLSPEARGGVPDETPIPGGANGGANRVAKSATPASAPSSAPPNTSLSFLQWSPEPDRRIAFIKVNGGPLTLAHEGDTVAGFTVVEIRRDAVELSSKGQSFTLQADQ